MDCNTEKVWIDLEKHIKMSTGNINPYLTTLAIATAHILGYETAK